jgi:hypothetical protein
LSSADEAGVSFARRPPLLWRPVLLVLAIAGAVLVDAVVIPQPWRGIEHRLLLMARWPALAVLVLLLASGLGFLVLTSRVIVALPDVGTEEPRLAPLRLTPGRSEVKVVTLIGLEPGCGVTTLAFNLAVSLAARGEKPAEGDGSRAVRPACLLAESPLSAALGLSPQVLAEHLAERPWDVRPEVVQTGVHHPSGCALFCLKGGGQPDDVVRRLIEQLRRHYDAVLIDGAVSSPNGYSVLDLADVLLLVGLPARSSVEPAGGWIERVWGTRRETTTAMVVNRVPAWPPPPGELILAFHHLVLLPEEPRAAACDLLGLPWSLDDRLAAVRELTGLARLLFPALTGVASTHAA